MTARLQKILKELKQGLTRIYGDRLDSVILYGSQARGDAGSDSGVDVLVVLKNDFYYGGMLDLSSDLVASLSFAKEQ